MHKLDHYVGRIVRLKDRAYEQIVRRGRRFVENQENCFLVAAVDRQVSRLICYGANQRIDVGPADIVLV